MTAVLDLERLAKSLSGACHEIGGRDAVVVPLSATVTGMALFGAGLGDLWWEGMSRHDHPAEVVSTTLDHLLPTHLRDALAFDADASADRALRRMGKVIVDAGGQRTLAAADLHGPSDILGGLYTLLRGRSGQSARGAFFTPMPVAKLMAAMALPEPGASVVDPCCGSGALLLATVREMREAGRNPAEVRFVGNDIDPLAAALAHLNLTFAGVAVEITVGDSLAPAE